MDHSNPLNRLNSLGQSIWLDFIDRSILSDGTLARLIQDDDLAGLTSNPAIFEKAISQDAAYTEDIARPGRAGMQPEALYTSVVLEDISRAADLFLPVYERTAGRDGYVSIEVSPLLARDSEASVLEAREIWGCLKRPNVMIKIPGTQEGLAAVRTLLVEGINVNVTLLFSVERYARVLQTYQEALEERLSRGLPLGGIASVASFFLSRIDVKVDALLDGMVADDQRMKAARELRGRAAIASAALAYRQFQAVTQNQRWQTLAKAGARVQRLLWASTGTKDPTYSDIKYVEPLIAVDTVNTLPRETLSAYRDHGQPVLRIGQSIADADEVMTQLAGLGVDMPALMQALEEEGIRKFVEPYQAILAALDRLRRTG
jgi:transaldolase